jgi:hypothetical protein
MSNHATSGCEDLVDVLLISRLRLALERHLHVIAHLHRGHRRVVGFAAVALKQLLLQRKLLRCHRGKRMRRHSHAGHPGPENGRPTSATRKGRGR